MKARKKSELTDLVDAYILLLSDEPIESTIQSSSTSTTR